MNKLTPALLVALCLPAGAQEFGASVNDSLKTVRMQAGAVSAGARKGVQQARHLAALEQALDAMNDGPEVGGQVASYVRDNKTEIRFEDQQPLSRTDGKAIVLAIQIGVYPRVIAPRVAWEASAMMLADMPDCAEKEYMRRSMTARVFVELGGDDKGLPVMEPESGDKDEALAKEMKLWLDSDAPAALKNIRAATKTPSLQDLASSATGADEARIDAAVSRYTQFMLDERTWRLSYGR